MKRATAAVLALMIGVGLAPAGTAARAQGDDVPTDKDNPPGCTTATSEATEGCGAQGRDNFGNAGHEPPIEACATKVAPTTGSTVTRILPEGPHRSDGSLAFVSGACVYLPPGYDANAATRYPVVYLLHGGGGDQADWVTFGDVRGILDRAYADNHAHSVIAVMPDGRSGQWFDYQDRSFLNETYLLRHLVPAVDARFRTIADRRGRALAGLSHGGYGALHLAAKAPDLFSVAGSMSGNLGARTMSGLGDTNAAYYQGSVPYQLASNLDAVDLIIDWGATCASDLTVDLCATWAFEQSFRADNMTFRSHLDEVGYTGHVDYRETEGGHAWRWWTTWLAERDLPFFFERLAPPTDQASAPSPVPPAFRYRSIAPSFRVWGYDVTVDRDVQEFLDLTDVTLGSLTVQGSGGASIVTPGRYTPGQSYLVEGAESAARSVEASPDGRLTIPVDLGPSHEQDQFTTEAQIAEAQGGYWVQRHVRVTPEGGTADPLAASWPTYEGPAPGLTPVGGPAFSTSAPGFEPTAAAEAPTAVPRPPAQRLATIAANVAEPVRKVSLPLTALFLGSIAAGAGAWWRRRPRASAPR